ncbi:hypothetical protein RIR_jg9545.t1 [Rhizophagus irregularis DAOM 181602=DAOM 197198]|nr:hypothetical protein RIR_jg9545.t1 [Rhizophagus irregularis DAOM 181602=DAOM 197198]
MYKYGVTCHKLNIGELMPCDSKNDSKTYDKRTKKILASQLQFIMRFVLDAFYHAALCLNYFLSTDKVWTCPGQPKKSCGYQKCTTLRLEELYYTCTIQRIILAVYKNFGQN